MSFKPLHDRVLVRRVGSDEKTAGGIIIPDTVPGKADGRPNCRRWRRRPRRERQTSAARRQGGDSVLFGKWSGTEVKIDGEELVIMKESDIMGVIVGAKKVQKAA